MSVAPGFRRCVVPGAALLALLGVLLLATPSPAQRVVVPAELQAELFSKVAAYDRNFAARAKSKAVILLVVNTRDAKSKVFTASIKSALSRLERVGGLPHQENVVSYESASKLAELVRSQRAAAVYLGPGLDGELEALKNALTGVDVLSLSAVPEHVPKGMVLGFDIASGKPTILVNLTQARKQNVNFSADVLKIMKVFR